MPVKRPTTKTARREEEAAKHPWIQLLDIEQQPQAAPPKNPVGRPSRRFPRDHKVTLPFTENELQAVDTLVALFKERIGPNIARSDIIAFMAFRLTSEIQSLVPEEGDKFSLPESISSFTDLAVFLEKGKTAQPAVKKTESEARRSKPKE